MRCAPRNSSASLPHRRPLRPTLIHIPLAAERGKRQCYRVRSFDLPLQYLVVLHNRRGALRSGKWQRTTRAAIAAPHPLSQSCPLSSLLSPLRSLVYRRVEVCSPRARRSSCTVRTSHYASRSTNLPVRHAHPSGSTASCPHRHRCTPSSSWLTPLVPLVAPRCSFAAWWRRGRPGIFINDTPLDYRQVQGRSGAPCPLAEAESSPRATTTAAASRLHSHLHSSSHTATRPAFFLTFCLHSNSPRSHAPPRPRHALFLIKFLSTLGITITPLTGGRGRVRLLGRHCRALQLDHRRVQGGVPRPSLLKTAQQATRIATAAARPPPRSSLASLCDSRLYSCVRSMMEEACTLRILRP